LMKFAVFCKHFQTQLPISLAPLFPLPSWQV
jgi:hypothetical protein